jgi:hypothetical protein
MIFAVFEMVGFLIVSVRMLLMLKNFKSFSKQRTGKVCYDVNRSAVLTLWVLFPDYICFNGQ